MISEQEFETRADETLHALERALGDLEDFEVDLAMGILTLSFEDGVRYIVNSHRAPRQIWMAAERNAWHFDYVPAEGRWIAAKSGDELRATLAAVVGRKLGKPFRLADEGAAPVPWPG